MELIHLGGEHSVTGSCHLLRWKGVAILVDCGLCQGRDSALPMGEWPGRCHRIRSIFCF